MMTYLFIVKFNDLFSFSLLFWHIPLLMEARSLGLKTMYQTDLLPPSLSLSSPLLFPSAAPFSLLMLKILV